MPRVVVIGGGISGLAAAHFLAPRAQVTVLEAGPRAGGVIDTARRDGHLVESAANGFLDSGAWTVRLAREAGVELVPAAPASRERFIVHRGRLRALPLSPPRLLTTPLLTLAQKARLVRESRVPAAPPGTPEESVEAFAQRRFGPGVRALADALVTGVWAGDPARLSLDFAFPRARELERTHGSVLRALRASPGPGEAGGAPARANLVAPREGMRALVDALATKLDVRCGVRARGILAKGPNDFEVLTGGETLRADHVIVALPPAQADAVLPEPIGPPARAQRSAPVAVVALSVPEADFLGRGFGYLAPESQNRFAMGAVFESLLFPGRAPPGRVLLRVLVGGVRHPERVELPHAELVGHAVEDLRQLGVIRGQAAEVDVARARPGIAQIELGHGALAARVRALEEAFPGLHLTGQGVRGVAVNNLVNEGATLARKINPTLRGDASSWE